MQTFYGDSAYDQWKVYHGLEQRGVDAIIPLAPATGDGFWDTFDREGWTDHPFRYERYNESGDVQRHVAAGHVFFLDNKLRVLVGRDLGEPSKLRLLVRQAL